VNNVFWTSKCNVESTSLYRRRINFQIQCQCNWISTSRFDVDPTMIQCLC